MKICKKTWVKSKKAVKLQCSSVKYLQKGAPNLLCNEKDSRITRLFKIDGNGNIDKNFDDSFDIKVVDDVISNLKCSNVNVFHGKK